MYYEYKNGRMCVRTVYPLCISIQFSLYRYSAQSFVERSKKDLISVLQMAQPISPGGFAQYLLTHGSGETVQLLVPSLVHD